MNDQQLAQCAELASLFVTAVIFVKWGGDTEQCDAYAKIDAIARGGDPRLREFASNLANNIYSMQFQ